MDIAYIAYLLFVFPGFCFVWTYRHFTKAPKLGEFEYAAWSFLFGTMMFFITISLGGEKTNFVLDLEKPFELFSRSLGIGLGIATIAAFPLGYLTAYISKKGVFAWIDEKLFDLLKRDLF